ncbi:MAG: TraR/DksA family transcriptional regulator [Balneolaceae bacterium]
MADQTTSKMSTHLTDEELAGFKKQLLALQEEEQEEIKTLREGIESINQKADDNRSGTAHHQGDVASDTQLKKTNYQLIENKQQKLEKIAAALDRIELGTYGICTVTGSQISKERLDAIPYALHTVDAKR